MILFACLLSLVVSCANDIEEEISFNTQEDITRALPTQELRCQLTTPASSGASILSSKGKFTVNCNWYLNDTGEAENIRSLELYIVDSNTNKEYYICDLPSTRFGSLSKEVEVFRPGAYAVKIVATISGRYYPYTKTSSPVYVNILFPTSLDAVSHFQADMDRCWSMTKASSREYGFYIYVEGNSRLTKGEVFESEPYNGTETLLLNMSYKDNDPSMYDPRVMATLVVSQFHTHPPLSNFPGTYWRPLGPSYIDTGNAPDGVPCLVYDYDNSKIGDKLYGMHRLDAPAKIYYYNGTRRPI